MRAEEVQLAHEWLLVKPEKLKTFKDVQIVPVPPKETMNVVKEEGEDEHPIQEVEEVERTLAYVIQRGKVVSVGAGDSMYNVGDTVFIRHATGIDFQWVGSATKGTCPKLMRKHEIIGKVI